MKVGLRVPNNDNLFDYESKYLVDAFLDSRIYYTPRFKSLHFAVI